MTGRWAFILWLSGGWLGSHATAVGISSVCARGEVIIPARRLSCRDLSPHVITYRDLSRPVVTCRNMARAVTQHVVYKITVV